MLTLDRFVALIAEELAFPLTSDDLAVTFDRLPNWDSLHLLVLLTALERETGRRLSLPDLLEAQSLEQIYRHAVAVRG
jgi:acyl carrier protein